MQANQPPAPAPSEPQGPYDFILNSEKPLKKGLAGKPGSSGQKQRIIFVVLGGLGMLTAILVFFSVLSSSGKGNTDVLLAMIPHQAEIVRIADVGITKARSPATRNFAATTSLTVETDQQAITSLLKKHGQKISTQQIAAKKSTETDSKLTAAEKNNRFDETFDTYMVTALTAYQALLKQAYDASASTTEKQTLGNSFNGINLIIEGQAAGK